MTFHNKPEIKLENFDTVWGLGDPITIEKEFYRLLPKAESETDKSIYLQILSQIALTQALQKKFTQAHETLDKAESMLKPEYTLAHARIILERGRVFQQAENIDKARIYFEQAFNLSKKHGFDFHTINAAHMIAIIAKTVQEKIQWNQQALNMASTTKDNRAQDWLGSLYNNLGQNYMEAEQFENALTMFQKGLEYRKQEKYAPNIRVATWAIGRALRALNRLDEALEIQSALLKEYDTITKTNNIDMPIEMFTLTRGWVYEELAELNTLKAKNFAHLAYNDLSNNEMFRTTEPQRLERLKEIQDQI